MSESANPQGEALGQANPIDGINAVTTLRLIGAIDAEEAVRIASKVSGLIEEKISKMMGGNLA